MYSSTIKQDYNDNTNFVHYLQFRLVEWYEDLNNCKKPLKIEHIWRSYCLKLKTKTPSLRLQTETIFTNIPYRQDDNQHINSVGKLFSYFRGSFKIDLQTGLIIHPYIHLISKKTASWWIRDNMASSEGVIKTTSLI